MKKIKTIIILVAIIFVSSCKINPCYKTRSITSQVRVYLYDYPEIPENVKMYVYSRRNRFISHRKEVNHIGNPIIDTTFIVIKNKPREYIKKEHILYWFSTPLLKNRNYRIVIDDTIYYDITNIVYDIRVDTSRMSTFGVYLRSCAIFEMNINGKTLDGEFRYLLPLNSFQLPYSMRRVVEK